MLAITIVLFVLVAVFVDLKPVVDENFFFSTSDPGFQQSKKIEQRFPARPEVIIAAGFAIFVLSDFPPTQRFGLVVLAGCIVDIMANLFVLPLLGAADWKKKAAK